MILQINADDLGASKSINKNILQGVRAGALNKVSILVNGNAFEEACQIVKMESLDHTLHLNFCEGKPVSDALDVPLLIGKNGKFKHSYFSFWIYALMSKTFRKQIRIEADAQICKYKQAFPEMKLFSLDSHQYYHMIPIVMRIILSLHKEHNYIQSLRMVREPFLFLGSDIKYSLKNLFSSNSIKWTLLRVFTFINKNRVQKSGINSNSYFCGVLYSGNMTYQLYNYFLSFLSGKSGPEQYAEILYHPGASSSDESKYWLDEPGVASFYSSKDRLTELNALIQIGKRK